MKKIIIIKKKNELDKTDNKSKNKSEGELDKEMEEIEQRAQKIIEWTEEIKKRKQR